MQWQEAYGADGTEDADPLPKMIGDEDPSLLGPYVPTELDTVEDGLRFAGVGPNDKVLDLGSGDGRWCVAAAQQFGAQCAVGVEIDALLVEESRRKAAQCGVAERATFACADLTAEGMSAAALCPGGQAFTLVIVFLLPEAEPKFEGQLVRLCAAGARVLSIAFALDRLRWLSLERRQGPMHLYRGSAQCSQSDV